MLGISRKCWVTGQNGVLVGMERSLAVPHTVHRLSGYGAMKAQSKLLNTSMLLQPA